MKAPSEHRPVAATIENPQSGFANAVRVHNALTARLEKRLLTWMALRLPDAIGPDHLTALGFASQVLAGVAYALSSRDGRFLWLVNFFLAVNWFGDSMDGTVARVRNRQRPRYGFYVDHILDAVGMFFLIGGIVLSGYMSAFVAYSFLIAYLLLSIEVYLATYSMGTFQLSYWRFGPT